MRLDGKTILLTGASSGIGKALAEEISGCNCRLLLVSRRYEILSGIKESLTGKPAEVEIFTCDVSNKSMVVETAALIKEKFGSIDIAILNAGAGERITPENFNSAAAEKIYGANLFGMIYWIEQLLPGFMTRKNGVIAGVTSMADNRGYSGSGFYSSSKAAASVFLEGLRIELDSYNIKVITVRPGFVRTPMTDKNEFKMPFLMEPDEAAKIIIRGIRKRKSYIDFPRRMFWITNIIGMLPRKLYELLARLQYKSTRINNEQ